MLRFKKGTVTYIDMLRTKKGTVTYGDSLSGWLRREFDQRQRQNPRYSMRAFARQIGLPSGRVSEIMRDHRALSEAKLEQVIARLKVPVDQATDIKKLMHREKATRSNQRSFGAAKDLPSTRILTDEEFRVIADPIHFAVMALINGDQPEARFAKKLGVSQRAIRAALRRLEGVGLIHRGPEGPALTENWISTETDKYSQALRRHHKRKLRQAIQAIDEVPLLERDVTSWTLNIDKSKIPMAKRLIQEFHKKMAKLLTAENQVDVYHLNVQLVPFRLQPDVETQ